MTITDVGIVGAGPAGAWAAYRLARGGVRVTLVDDSHPREKPCGGGLTGRALDLVRPGVDMGSIPSVRIAGASFEHGERRAACGLTDDGATASLVVASRRDFDGALLRAAVAAGAIHVRSRARNVERRPEGWRIVTRDGHVDCRWLVGADGPASLVRRRVFRPLTRADLSIATGYFVHGATSDEIAVAFEDSPAGYLWSFPRPDHLAVGICAQADESTTPQLQTRALGWIERTLAAGGTLEPAGRGPRWAGGPLEPSRPATRRVEPSCGSLSDRSGPRPRWAGGPLERYAWPIPSLTEAALTRERPAGDGWMLIGDAAGLVDPITREGIYFALLSADIAAQSLLTARDPALRFAVQIREDIHAELRRAARLKARFFRPHFIGLLLRALQSSGPIGDVMGDLIAGRQTYRGLRRRLLSTFELRLMLDVYRQLPASSFQLPASRSQPLERGRRKPEAGS